MNKGNTDHSTTGLTASELASFQDFHHQCGSRGLLKRPAGLAPEDVVDGIQDETTLLYRDYPAQLAYRTNSADNDAGDSFAGAPSMYLGL